MPIYVRRFDFKAATVPDTRVQQWLRWHWQDGKHNRRDLGHYPFILSTAVAYQPGEEGYNGDGSITYVVDSGRTTEMPTDWKEN